MLLKLLKFIYNFQHLALKNNVFRHLCREMEDSVIT